MQTGEARNFGLDLARTTAILLVVVSHLSGPLHLGGVLGVELFFVLSGFLIGRILVRAILHEGRFGAAQLWDFWQRRWYRTLPAYWFYLALWYLLAPWNAVSDYRPDAVWLLRFLTFTQNLGGLALDFFGISWSLSVEEWFYLLFPSLTVVLLAFFPPADAAGKVRRVLFASLLLIAFAIGSRLASDGYPYYGHRLGVWWRLDALMYGVLMAFLQVRHPAVWARAKPLALPGLLLAGLGAWCFLRIEQDYSAAASVWACLLVPLGFAGLLPLLAGLPAGRLPAWFKVPVQKVALWSYSLYLCHLLVYGLAFGCSTTTGRACRASWRSSSARWWRCWRWPR